MSEATNFENNIARTYCRCSLMPTWSAIVRWFVAWFIRAR